MFTFSFSSAFAAATGDLDADTYAVVNVSKVYEEVAKAEAQKGADIERLEATALNEIFKGKTSKEFGAGKLVVTYDQVKAYYDSEVVNKVKAQASKEAADIYTSIQAALNDGADYIKIVDNRDNAGKVVNAAGEVVYSVYVGFTGNLSADNNATGTPLTDETFTGVFDGENLDAGSKSADIAKDAFAQAVTDKLAEIAAISEGAYLAKDQDTVKALKAKASKQVSQLATVVANGSFEFSAVSGTADAPANLDYNLSGTTEGFAGLLGKIYTPAVNEASASGLLATALGNLTLSADEPTEAAKLAWAQAQMMSKFETAINDEYDQTVETPTKNLLNESLKGSKADQSEIDRLNKIIADAKKLKDAALEIATYLVNECDDYKQLITVDSTSFAESLPKFASGKGNWNYANGVIASPLIENPTTDFYYGELVKVVGYVKDAKDEAEALKATIEIDGTTAVDIDNVLEKTIDKIYTTGTRVYLPAYTADAMLHSKQHALTGVDCFDDATGRDTTVKVNSKTYNVVNSWSETEYEGSRLDEVKAIKKETKAAIMAAETVADAEAAFLAGYEKYDAVLTKSDKAINQAAKAFVDLKAKYVAQLTAELNYTIAGINAAKSNNAPTTTAYVGSLTADLEKAYTTDELTAKFEKLSEEVKALKDKTTLEAEKKALEERCKAYNSKTVTAADKEDLVALRKDVAAFRKYNARLGASYIVADYGLNSKLTAVANIEKKAVEDAYKVINKDGKATLDEAKAVADLRAALDAYNDGWTAVEDDLEAASGFDIATLTLANLGKFEREIFLAEKDRVESMIAKLPADGSDVSAVKAAREAYDALTLCQKTYVGNKYYDKLVDCEKLRIRNVEALKLTASSTAKKGSITVKWKVKGDASGVTYYEVRRSTKANSGYGTKPYFKTTKKSYKNTKALKKGTRYYYKVRAVAEIGGAKYVSDWSNKAYRKAK